MRKFFAGVFALCLLPCFCFGVLANSAAAYWEGYPSSEVLRLEEDCPITVLNEELTFDLRDADQQGRGGTVSAVYTMHNPGQQTEEVQMAFPLVDRLYQFDPASVQVRADGEEIPFQLLLGDAVEQDEELPDVAEILPALQREEYQPTQFDLAAVGRLHTFSITPQPQGKEFLELALTIAPGEEKLLGSGFNSFSRFDDGSVQVGASRRDGEAVTLFDLDGTADITAEVYRDGAKTQLAEGYSVEHTVQAMTAAKYLEQEMARQSDPDWWNQETFRHPLCNLMLRKLDEYYQNHNRFAEATELFHPDTTARTVVILYTIPFTAGQEREVSVSYGATAAADRRRTEDWVYFYTYLLSPARYWADFGTLDLMIKPPAAAPYMTQSSLELTRGDDGTYTAAFDRLPDRDLTFALCASETPAAKSAAGRGLWWLLVPVGLAAILALFLLQKRRR